jgi:hypothetical protein
VYFDALSHECSDERHLPSLTLSFTKQGKAGWDPCLQYLDALSEKRLTKQKE